MKCKVTPAALGKLLILRNPTKHLRRFDLAKGLIYSSESQSIRYDKQVEPHACPDAERWNTPCLACLKIVMRETENRRASSSAVKARPV